MIDGDELDQEAPILAIAAAAELAGMHPQTLRQYDRLGLVVPARTQGGSRRYSLRHVHQLREVARMSADGMSLPAIARIIELEDRVRELHVRVQTLEMQVRVEVENRPGSRVFAAETSGSVISLRRGTRVRRTREVVLWQPRRELSAPDADQASAPRSDTPDAPPADAS
jgi:MerR family transcriptional regulator/heat shock protein HspR